MPFTFRHHTSLHILRFQWGNAHGRETVASSGIVEWDNQVEDNEEEKEHR